MQGTLMVLAHNDSCCLCWPGHTTHRGRRGTDTHPVVPELILGLLLSSPKKRSMWGQASGAVGLRSTFAASSKWREAPLERAGAFRKNVRYLLRGRKSPQKQFHVTQNLMLNVETLPFTLPYHEECLNYLCCIQLDFYLCGYCRSGCKITV